MTPLISTINSYIYNQTVTPGANGYASSITITANGDLVAGTMTALDVGVGISGATIVNEVGGELQSHGNNYTVILQSSAQFINDGVIKNRGLDAQAGGYILNNGLISGYGAAGVGMNGVVLTSANLTNRSNILASHDGVLATNGVDISNHGKIQGGFAGVELEHGGAIGNAIYIVGGTYGVLLDDGGFVGSANLIAGGTDAVLNKAGALVLNVYPLQTRFSGGVVDEAGTGVINLQVPYSGDLNLGGTFSGFETVNFLAGSNWTLEGNISELAAGETINGFTAGENIQLDGFGATGDTYVSGTGLILADGTEYETIGITGSLVTANFIVSNMQSASVISFVEGSVAPAGDSTIPSGSTVSTPIIGMGSSESASSGATVKNPVISGGTLELAAGSTVIGNINFSGDTGKLILDGNIGVGTTIVGFAPGDSIEFKGVAFSSADTVSVATPGVLDIHTAGGDYYIAIEGAYVGEKGFTLVSDPGNLTLEEYPTCFASGTRISTARGEIAVEDLHIGDLVKTLHAGMQKIKWIGHRSYAAPFVNHANVLPICLRQSAIAPNVPARDLWVSPGHAICIDDMLIHASRLVNGVSIFQAESVESVTYYHIELEHHEVLLAENCPAESFMGEVFRRQFQNFEEFYARYPGELAPENMCLARLEDGFALSAIQRRLAARAQIAQPAELGALIGHVDKITEDRCIGWARNANAPDVPVYVDIFDDKNIRIGRVLANMFRADVKQAGFGAGYHGFEFLLPEGHAGGLSFRRAADGVVLGEARRAMAA